MSKAKIHTGARAAAYAAPAVGAAVLFTCSLSLAVIAPQTTYNSFPDLDYDRIQEVCEAGGTLNQSFHSNGGLMTFMEEGTHTWNAFLIEGFCHDDHALIHENEPDALAVVLRRTEALLNHLKVTPGSPDLSAYEQEFNDLKTQSAGVDPANRAARKELYYKVCAVRRKIAFSNPLLEGIDKLLFVEYSPWGGGWHMCDQYFGCNAKKGGGLYILENAFGENPQRREVLTGPVESGPLAGTDLRGGGFLSPELSYDGTTIYFAWTAAKGGFRCSWGDSTTYDVFKVNVDGTELTQLTTDDDNGGYYNDFDPCELPNGRIVFLSERRTGRMQIYGRCHGRKVPSYTLFSMKPDGSDMYPIAYHETNQWHPSVDNNGMIVFTQWDYVDRDSNEAHHLWICYPDGSDPRAPHGNYDHPWGDRGTPYFKHPIVNGLPHGGFRPRKGGSCLHPWGEWNPRAIPESHKYIATAAPHHGKAFGSLVMIDTRVEDDGMMAQLRRVTPDCLFPEAERAPAMTQENNPVREMGIWDEKQLDMMITGKYATAWPLSEDFYIVNYCKNIILLDRFGNKEVLYTVEWDDVDDFRKGFRPIDPIPLRPRKKPPVLAKRTFDGEDAPEDHPRATISIQNIYETYPVPWPEGVVEEKRIKWLRIIQFIPKTTPGKNTPKVGAHSMATCRMSLGIVPVEADGSVYCDAPVNIPIYFQALDENQMALQSMKAVTYVHAGEQLSCVGCHESKWKAIPPLRSTPIAFTRSPSQLQEEFPGHHTDPTKGAIPFNYHLLAKPALQRAGYGGEYKSYWSPGGGSRSIPGYVGTHQSKIGDDLVEKYTSGSIGREDFHRIVMWIDLNCNELGWDHNVDAQKAGRVVWPEIDVGRDNVLGTEHRQDPPGTPHILDSSGSTLAHRNRYVHGNPPEPDGISRVSMLQHGERLTISNISRGPALVQLWNSQGDAVFHESCSVTHGCIQVPFEDFSAGVYVVRVQTPSQLLHKTVSAVR